MRRRAFITAIFLFTACTFCIGQKSKKDEIAEAAKQYFVYMENWNSEECMEMLYPKMFELVPKQAMLAAFKKMAADTTTIITFSNMSVDQVGKVLQFEGVDYSLVRYSYKMTMAIPSIDLSLPDSYGLTLDLLRGQFGKRNVSFDEATKSYVILANRKMFMINDPLYAGWKIIEKKKEMLPLIERLMPAEVIRKLK